MGKKKPNKNTKKRSDSELIQAAERATARGKWKDAQAAYKELNKRQPGHYDEALLQVQVKRYRAFLDSDMFESAQQLLDTLRGKLPPEQLKTFELQRAISQQDHDAIATLTWQSLEAQQAAGTALDPTILESLIFSDNPPPDTLATHPEIETVLAARTGLQAICQNDSESLATAMAAIKRQSSLAHWKLLLRALDAWYSGQDEQLEKCLEKLTHLKGQAAHITEGLRLLHAEESPVTRNALASSLALHGTGSADVADHLLQTDAYLQINQYAQALDFAISKFDFGSPHKNKVDLIVLDRFVSTFREGNHKLTEHVHNRLGFAQERQPEWYPFLRAKFAESELPCDCIDCIDEFGQRYLKILAKRGASKQIQARAHLHLADEFLSIIQESYHSERLGFFLHDAIEILRDALELDPEFADAGLLLVKAYNMVKDASAANKLLDELAAQHPDNAAILHLAGNQCIERRTWVRGLRQLEQALALDPHRPALKQDYIRSLFQKAQSDYKKKQYEKGLACFVKMQPYLQDNRQEIDYWLDSALMRLRHLELETSYHHDSTEIEELRSMIESDWQDREQMRQIVEYLFIELLSTKKRQAETHKRKVAFFRQKTLPETLTPEQVLQLFQIHKEANLLDDTTPSWSTQLRHLLDAYRTHYQAERLAGMLRILWLAVPQHIEPEELAETCKLWSKADRHHPQLKILLLLAKFFLNGNAAEDYLVELEQALKTARQRNDSIAIKEGKQLQEKIQDYIHEPRPNFTRHNFADSENAPPEDSDNRADAAQAEFEFTDPSTEV